MRRCIGLGLVLALSAAPGTLLGQEPGAVGAPAEAPVPQAPQVQTPPAPLAPVSPQEAGQTRQQLRELLRELPPSVQGVVQLDPSMLDNAQFMAVYPRLAGFLAQHPELRRDPAFFFGSNFGGRVSYSSEPNALRTFESLATGTLVLTGVMTALIVLGWLLGQAVSYRRWIRRSRMQAEMHTKILDRLPSNEDLLAYIQTPAGRDLMSFASPAPIESGEGQATPAPLGRILWSVQIGVVLAALGMGLLFVQRTVPEEVVQGFGALGIIVLTVGLGAIASAGVAWGLSLRLGILPAHKDGSSPDA